MGIINNIKGWLTMHFLSTATQKFNVKALTSSEMDALITECGNVYGGKPYWLDDDIKTINFAKALCSETARLATLGISIKIEGDARAKWLQEQIDSIYFELRKWVEYGCAYGTIVLKPNGESIDVITPENFTITSQSNGKITGIIFQEQIRSRDGEHFYNRLEYHSRENDNYRIINKTYYSDARGDLGNPIDISKTPWNALKEEIIVNNAENNLFGVLTMPHANNVDLDSPMGMPIISEAIEELKDLDIAYSRHVLEIIQSKRIILIDSDKMITGGSLKNVNYSNVRKSMGLPDMVRNVEGNGTDDFYQEINPLIQTSVRLEGINSLLSQIGYKIGFSNGYFVFNERSGIQTATGVEAEQQRTVQFVKDIRDRLESCMDDLIYALNAFADGYDLAPVGKYEILYDFGDILYSYEADKATWWGYVMSGKVPAWKYFVKFEGMDEEEARQMIEEAMPKEEPLFPDEE